MRVPRVQLVLGLALVGLLALSVLMVVFYITAVNKTPQLEDDIASKEQLIAAMEGTCDIDEQKARLYDMEQQIANEAPFPGGPFDKESKYDNKQITDAIFEITDDAYVYLDSLSHQKETTAKVGEGSYRADSYSIKCSIMDPEKWERLITLLELFEELREDQYPTLMIDSVKFPKGSEGFETIQFTLFIITQTF
jgi:hypothetical protein